MTHILDTLGTDLPIEGATIRRCPPFYMRELKSDWNMPHVYGQFHSANPSRMKRVSYTVLRLRRKRVGQLTLFN